MIAEHAQTSGAFLETLDQAVPKVAGAARLHERASTEDVLCSGFRGSHFATYRVAGR